MKQYKAVFLDWDDTIGDWASAEHQALRDIYEQYHLIELYPTFDDYLAAYKPYNLMLWGQYGRGEITKDYLHLERFLQPLKPAEGAMFHGRSKEELAHEMGDVFLQLTNRYFSVLPDAARVVRLLAAKDPLTIISNGFKEVQYYKFAHSGLEDCFTHILISEEVGINKPQPGIFDIALARNGVSADEAVMIGDSFTSDIAGAQAAGIDQIWLHPLPADAPTAEHAATTDEHAAETATYIVPRLADVLNILQ